VSLGVEECLLFIQTFYLPGDTLSAASAIDFRQSRNQNRTPLRRFRSWALLSGFGCGFAALGNPWLNFLKETLEMSV